VKKTGGQSYGLVFMVELTAIQFKPASYIKWINLSGSHVICCCQSENAPSFTVYGGQLID